MLRCRDRALGRRDGLIGDLTKSCCGSRRYEFDPIPLSAILRAIVSQSSFLFDLIVVAQVVGSVFIYGWLAPIEIERLHFA